MLLPVYMNGTWYEDAPPGLPFDDPGVLQGVTIVETLRTYGGQLFEPQRHWPRLEAGLAYLGLDRFPDAHSPDSICRELLDRRDGDDDVAVVLLVTPGRERPTVVCHSRTLGDYQPWHRDGLPLVVPTVGQGGALPRAFKHRSRLHWWKADREARGRNTNALAWLTDDDGVLTETSIGNVLVVRGGCVLHAPPGRVVPGITSGIISELADAIGLSNDIAALRPTDLRPTDELLMTSTGCGVVPIASVDGQSFPARDIYSRLCDAWVSRFGFDVRQVG